MTPKLQIDSPKNFRFREVVIINLIANVWGSIIVICGFMGLYLLVNAIIDSQHSQVAVGLLLLIISGTLLFRAPSTLFANSYVRDVVAKYLNEESQESVLYTCQITLSPRLYDGFRGFLEDADDLGYLQLTTDGVLFTGDHIQIVLPYSCIEDVSYTSFGWRALWLGGKTMKLTTNAFPRVDSLKFGERQSNTVTSSGRISKAFTHELDRRFKLAGALDEK